MTADAVMSSKGIKIDWTRLIAMLTGVGLFIVVYDSPSWPDAIDPVGKHFALSPEGKGAIAVFLLAGIWWVFEVIPIGVTSLVIGITQALFMIRPAKEVRRKRNVAVGDIVAKGDIIGFVGNTGRSTGNHLHFETLLNGRAADPIQFYPSS